MDLPSHQQFSRAGSALRVIDYATLRAVLAAQSIGERASLNRHPTGRLPTGTMADRIAFFAGRFSQTPRFVGPFAPFIGGKGARKEAVYLGASTSGRNMTCKEPPTSGAGTAAPSGGKK